MTTACFFDAYVERDATLDEVARRLKSWALERGATHYCHWFQPLTGATAEKHEAFAVADLKGRDLMQGEPDASSFPNGGLRTTFESRGYTTFDPDSPPFIWEIEGVRTLCIPSVFCSWKGEALDTKIPLLRSEQKINQAALRLLQYFEMRASQVFSTLGCEQEYFVVDAELARERPDLVQLGKTLFGNPPAKNQQLSDHYLGNIRGRILSFMQDFEERASALGIPLQTRHNEVAPAQHEVAPRFEKASLAVDHNILLMELMRKVAEEHGLKCLLHEKPFAGINGSGKHLNWSLQADTGINLLDASSPCFVVLVTAILHAVHKHAALLRASIGSFGNDARLGAHEAPPAIISVFLGKELETYLEEGICASKEQITLGLPQLPALPKHSTDRNRTSPFAFTGNKFEFRALGSAMSPAFPSTVLNAIVAESLNVLMDAIEKEGITPAVKRFLEESRQILFCGDNYAMEWQEEAKKRGLPNLPSALDAFEVLVKKETVAAMQGVLSTAELAALCKVLKTTYCTQREIEQKLFIELFEAHLLPAAMKTQKLYQETAQDKRAQLLHDLVAGTSEAIAAHDFALARSFLDKLEPHIDAAIYPFPKVWELLYQV